MAQTSPPMSVPAPAHFVNENRAPRDDDGSSSQLARLEPTFQAPKPMSELPNPYGGPSTNVVGTDISNSPRGSLPRANASDRISQPPPYTPFEHADKHNIQPQSRTGMLYPNGADGPRLDKRQNETAIGRESENVDLESVCRDSAKCLLVAVLRFAASRHYVAIDLGIYKNRHGMTSRAPSKRTCATLAPLFTPTTDVHCEICARSARRSPEGVFADIGWSIAYNPVTANAGAMMDNGTGTGGTQFASTGNASMVGAGAAQQPVAQYYSNIAPYKQGLGNPMQAQTSIPQAVTGMQPAAVTPMIPASAGGGQITTMGMSGGLAGGTIGTGVGLDAANGTVVNAAAQEGPAEAAGEEAEAEAGIGACWSCCRPAATLGGSAETAAGGPVGPDAAAAPGPPGPAGPSGERIVQYFKSGYNSAAAGANASNNLPAAIDAPSSRGAVPPV
ncbi:hypothetical protein ACEPAH_3097 [Sanghuangporus vaninii]